MAQDDTGKVFAALADDACRRLLEVVAQGPACAAALAQAAGLSAAAARRPLATLLGAGLIRSADGELAFVPQALAPVQAFAAALSKPLDDAPAARADAVDTHARAWARKWPAYPADAYAIGQRLLRLAWHVERALKDAAASADLVAVDLLLLDALILAGPPWTRTPTQLQTTLLLTKGGITKCISRLEAQGLVERQPDPSDGRGVLVAATPRARELIRKMVAEFQFGTDFVASMQLPPDRRAQLAALLREMLALADAEALRRGTRAGPGNP